jgi:hypothetical protein
VKSLLQRGQVHREDGVDHKRLVEGASVQWECKRILKRVFSSSMKYNIVLEIFPSW